MNFLQNLLGGGQQMPRPLTPAIAQQQQAAQGPGFMQMLGDPNSPVYGAAMGLGGALLDYGRPQMRDGDAGMAGAMSAGINGMLGGLAAQKAQARQDKIDAMLQDLADRQIGLLDPSGGPKLGPQRPQINAQMGPLAPMPAPAPVQPNPMGDTQRLMAAQSTGGPLSPMRGSNGMIPGVY